MAARQSRFDEAIEAAQQAVAYDPNDADSQVALADALHLILSVGVITYCTTKSFPVARPQLVTSVGRFDLGTVPLTNQTDVNEAIAADELDKLLMDAKKERGRPKWKAAR
ncbi:MAG: hypothetical protein V3T12_06625 [Acidiferrobacterales bacterium]